jgi:hypothetical protein
MNTIDELVSRGVTRVQHEAWNTGEYMKLRIVKRDDGQARSAPNALKYTQGEAPSEQPVYALAGNGEPDWRPYVGPRDKHDTGE